MFHVHIFNFFFQNHENLNLIRDFCFSVFNAWNQETKSLSDKIESLTALERSERGKIKQEVGFFHYLKKFCGES